MFFNLEMVQKSSQVQSWATQLKKSCQNDDIEYIYIV